MQKYFFLFILVIIYTVLFTACTSSPATAYPTYHPDAVKPMSTIFAWQTTCTAVDATIESLGETATFAFYTEVPTSTLTPMPSLTPLMPTMTLTPSPPPIQLPASTQIMEELNNAMKNKLGEALNVGNTITNVEFIKSAEGDAYDLIIKMQCSGENCGGCVSDEAFVKLINACHKNNHKIADLIPKEIRVMQLWVFQSDIGEGACVIFDVSWSDIQSYVAGNMPVEVFTTKINRFSPSAQ